MTKHILGEGKYLRLIKNDRWEFVERTNCSGVVLIVAVFEGKLVLTEQRRASLSANVIELPAGLVGDTQGAEKESLLEAARRELIEETGLEAGEMVALTEGPPSAGQSSEVVTLFLAKHLKRVGKGGGDENENIVVHEIPFSRLDGFLEEKKKKGSLIDPKVFAGVYFAIKYGLIGPDIG